ncbi:MAG TPA: hypothetical protein VGB75_08860 [Jatrophihabitans sp.]|uniref:hypothetical protein n=1 Tax=Jatrophihabitans sp. TaxID=1932789 RepID=UPI002EF16EEC
MELVLVGDRPLAEAAFLSGSGTDNLVIDAAKLSFACPLDLAGIVATAHWAAGGAIRVTLKLPSDPAATAYLQRMDVLRQMPARTQIVGRVPPDARTDHHGSLMEVTALNERNVDDLSERLGPLVTGFYKDGSKAGAAVFRACSELMSNATEHGLSERGAFMAVQLHTGRTTGSPRLEFAVCDTGIGVMNHLRQNPRHAHLTRDEVAIAKAIRAGVSGVKSELRGNGLSDAISDTSRYGRVDFQIRSGKGEVRVAGGPESRRTSSSGRPDQTSGTWAWLTHHLPSERQTVVQSRQ